MASVVIPPSITVSDSFSAEQVAAYKKDASRNFSMTNSGPDSMANEPSKNIGSLPGNFDKKEGKINTVDIVKNYRWTLSEIGNRTDIPYIELAEHRNDESMLMKQFGYYVKGSKDAAKDASWLASTRGILDVYEEMFPDNPTSWKYRFPYFAKSVFELTTPEWKQVDPAGGAISGAANGLAGILDSLGATSAGAVVRGAIASGNVLAAGAELTLKGTNPHVGIVDRPRIFENHAERAITVQFPLYNTVDQGDWVRNRDFYYRFASQNLFAKKNFITGVPPVFYRVYVPGQYFSFASCVTNINIENLGNTRMMDSKYVIPDAFQVSITLQEMLMPSLNQYQALVNGSAWSNVNVINTYPSPKTTAPVAWTSLLANAKAT